MTQPAASDSGRSARLRRLTHRQVATSLGDDVPGWVTDARALTFAIPGQAPGDGFVALLPSQQRPDTARLAWQVRPELRGHGLATDALRRVIAHGFDDLGLRRVEARVSRDNRPALRSAARAGLRIEGLLREYRPGVDAALLGRLSSDPDPGSRGAFTAWLNSSLPTKRAIAQALIRDDAGRVLACELVYKHFWDLPGGVVDPLESPATAVLRELREELGVHGTVRRLAAVSWLPAWRGWDDATLFVFEVAVPAQEWADIRLQPREIRAVHWCDASLLAEHVADYTARVAHAALDALATGAAPVYLEDGRAPDW